MARLVKRSDWEEGFASKSSVRVPSRRTGWAGAYHELLLFEGLYPSLMPDLEGRRVLEVGSAPGRHLVQLHRELGLEPYGVELTDSGADLNRQVFERSGIDPDRVIQADFFEASFQESYRGFFDGVLSRGFLEHFDNAAEVLDLHLNLLAPGGYLLVIIPNLRGVYGAWLRRFNPSLLARHNLDYMRLEVFRGLFDRPDVVTLHCGYLGTFDTWAFGAEDGCGVLLRTIVRGLRRAQKPANVILRTLFGRRGKESATFSPFLIFVGTKTGTDSEPVGIVDGE